MNIKVSTLLFALFIIGTSTLQGQLKVYTTGNIGVKSSNPVSLFSVDGNGFADSRTTLHNTIIINNPKALRVYQLRPSSGNAYAITSAIETGSTNALVTGIIGTSYRGTTAYTTGQSVGLRGQSGNATSGWNFGIYGEILGSNNGAAIFGIIPGKSNTGVTGMFAGYFKGNVKIENDLTVNAVFTTSDINLKKEIVNLESSNLAKLLQLQAIKYKLKTPLELNSFPKEITDTARVLMTDVELNDPLYTKTHMIKLSWKVSICPPRMGALKPELTGVYCSLPNI